MNKKEETLVEERISFRRAFDNLTVWNKREVKNELAQLMGISVAHVYRRMRGESPSNELEKDGIERVFAKYGVTNIWD